MKKPLIAVLLVVPAMLIAAAAANALVDDEPYVYIYRTDDAKKAEQGWLGVSIQDMTPHLARTMNLKTREGALVTDVSGDSPAYKAGIKRDDIIVEVDGKAIWDASDLTSAIRKSKPGTTVNIAVMRSDEKKSFKATLGESPRRPVAAPVPPMIPRVHVAHAGGAFGLTIRTLGEQLAEYFGAPKGQGVLVESVKKESPAEKAGIKAGDVLLKIGERPIESTRDVRRALRKYEGEKATMEVLRKGSHLTVTFDVPEMYGSYYYEMDGVGRAGMFEFDEFEIPEIDIDLEGLNEFRFNMENLKPKLEILRERVRKGGEEIRRQTDGLREQIRKAIRSVVVTTSY